MRKMSQNVAVPKTDVGDSISPKQRKAIAALMTCRTVRDAAKGAQIGEREIYRWMGERAFQTELKRAGQEAIDIAIRRLVSLSGMAIDTLEGVMNSKKATENVRLRAADIALNRLPEIKGLFDLEERVAKLEQVTGEAGYEPGNKNRGTRK